MKKYIRPFSTPVMITDKLQLVVDATKVSYDLSIVNLKQIKKIKLTKSKQNIKPIMNGNKNPWWQTCILHKNINWQTHRSLKSQH